MHLRRALAMLVAVSGTAGSAAGQVTGTASFNAPYRAFTSHEFGGTLSFNSGDVTGIEGQYRFGYRAFDIGARGGIAITDGSDAVLLGAEGRGRVLTHSERFPLDGAVVTGLGIVTGGGGGTVAHVPVGLSLGRRVDPENSSVSLVPYVQPTLNLLFGDTGFGSPKVGFSVGFGLDARVSRLFDVRVSAGLGTDWGVEGFAVSAVWVH